MLFLCGRLHLNNTVRKISALGYPLNLLTVYIFLWTAPNPLLDNIKFESADPAL